MWPARRYWRKDLIHRLSLNPQGEGAVRLAAFQSSLQVVSGFLAEKQAPKLLGSNLILIQLCEEMTIL